MIQSKSGTFKGPKAMPILLLLDISGSMGVEGKIDSLNKAIKEMLAALKKEEAESETLFLVGAVTFGNEVENIPFTEVDKVPWQSLSAGGQTPMGSALEMAKSMIENREEKMITGRAWAPAVVLVSDGRPYPEDENRKFERLLGPFINEGRSSKCDRWAMGIGSDLDEQFLRRFAKPRQGPDQPDQFFIGGAAEIVLFFKRVTMTISKVLKSKDFGPRVIGGNNGPGNSTTLTIARGSDDDDPV
jgi:uncharacterized protein YegL